MSRLKIIACFFILLSLFGFLDATYLAIEHYRGVVPPCSIVHGCEQVTTSRYSMIFGVPVALLGSLYYVTLFILTIAYLDSKKLSLLTVASYLTFFGFAASIWFVYLQWHVIGAWCVYCLGSTTTSTLLFVLGVITLRTVPTTWWEKIKARWN